ncbi:uncharacterized protein LOC101898587 isoform X1 [Musca domestica]|uniref:Uncharacterized protein LOC101898587 isoform X1 n=1 Tax=Musca domestica TaxID=7370 RepID=A0A9J7DBD3_MUSDO|nr:uncharacterized protein LOC101898587 isoform X1 [Musca domestica]
MSIFGPEFDQIWPKAGSALKLTEFGKRLLKQCENIKKPENVDVDIEAFMKKSSEFPLEFGSNNCRVMSQPKDRYPIIKKQISSAYPVIHERVLQLYLDFLEYKCLYGHSKEKDLYQNMTLEQFVQRLLTKRCVAFVGPMDSYMLINGRVGYGVDYDLIGTDEEKNPLILSNCLSYDEVKLSAFLSVSSDSELINNGNRKNMAVIEKDPNKIEREGVVIGLIGARFQRPFVMDYQDIIISREQNVEERGYGPNNSVLQTLKKIFVDKKNYDENMPCREYRKIWKKFYEDRSYLYCNVKKDNKRFGDIESSNSTAIFDNVVMKKRFTISFDTLLLEAQSRAALLNKQAYVHIVGIGLGVWRAAVQQTAIFLETFQQRVLQLLPKLNNIGVLHFSWFGVDQCGDLKHNGFIESPSHPHGGIKTFLANRNPADKLMESNFGNMLLVISYAWDANALPGNEFWQKHLGDSSDSSTASSTLIAELHNGHINTEWVCGGNLHIASPEYGVIHISDYVHNLN